MKAEVILNRALQREPAIREDEATEKKEPILAFIDAVHGGSIHVGQTRPSWPGRHVHACPQYPPIASVPLAMCQEHDSYTAHMACGAGSARPESVAAPRYCALRRCRYVIVDFALIFRICSRSWMILTMLTGSSTA